LLHKLGFCTGSPADRTAWAVDDDELILIQPAPSRPA
jgi:hypothetical protein